MLVLLECETLSDAAELMRDARCRLVATAETRGGMVNAIEDIEVRAAQSRRSAAAREHGTDDLVAIPFPGVVRDRRASAALQRDLAAQQYGAVALPPEGDEDDDVPLTVPAADPADRDEDGDEVADPTEVWPAPPPPGGWLKE